MDKKREKVKEGYLHLRLFVYTFLVWFFLEYASYVILLKLQAVFGLYGGLFDQIFISPIQVECSYVRRGLLFCGLTIFQIALLPISYYFLRKYYFLPKLKKLSKE